jgi:K+-transporting ATPase KdpF subunit
MVFLRLTRGHDVRSGFYRLNYRFLSDRPRVCARLREVAVREKLNMSLETILTLAVSTLLLIYLVFALLRPEKF